jgi:hypothetical protein
MLMSAAEQTTFSLSSAPPSPPERRRQPRHITILRVGTIHLENRRELCLIRNISAGGLLASQGTMDNGWRPRLPRVEVDRLATVRVGSRVYGVSTRDISQGGVKIETDAPFEDGTEVVLTLDKFRPIHGVVRWYSEGLCGIAFNQVLPFRELIDWLRSR